MMVFDQRLTWFHTLFALRGTVLAYIWARLLLAVTIATAVALWNHHDPEVFKVNNLTMAPFTLVGLALSIILGFRNQTCFQRYWEGRELWGRLVNMSRTTCRQTLTLIDAPPEQAVEAREVQREVIHGVCGYIHALRLGLRGLKDHSVVARLVPALASNLHGTTNLPTTIALWIGQRLAHARRRGWLDSVRGVALEECLRALVDAQGGCERIRNTPIPFAYTLLIHRIAGMYCLTLPFGIITQTGPFTPLVTLLVTYAFFGLDAIGDELEDPFGVDPQDLPLDQLSTMIEINLREALGETDLPPPVRPKGGILT